MIRESYRYSRIPRQIEGHHHLTPAAKLVYGCMLGYSQKTGYCFASVERICDRLYLSDSTVRDAMKQLAAAKCIEPVEDKEGNQIAMKAGYRDGRTNLWKCLYTIKSGKPNLVSMPRSARAR